MRRPWRGVKPHASGDPPEGIDGELRPEMVKRSRFDEVDVPEPKTPAS
jgi:hypothetical protein